SSASSNTASTTRKCVTLRGRRSPPTEAPPMNDWSQVDIDELYESMFGAEEDHAPVSAPPGSPRTAQASAPPGGGKPKVRITGSDIRNAITTIREQIAAGDHPNDDLTIEAILEHFGAEPSASNSNRLHQRIKGLRIININRRTKPKPKRGN